VEIQQTPYTPKYGEYDSKLLYATRHLSYSIYISVALDCKCIVLCSIAGKYKHFCTFGYFAIERYKESLYFSFVCTLYCDMLFSQQIDHSSLVQMKSISHICLYLIWYNLRYNLPVGPYLVYHSPGTR